MQANRIAIPQKYPTTPVSNTRSIQLHGVMYLNIIYIYVCAKEGYFEIFLLSVRTCVT